MDIFDKMKSVGWSNADEMEIALNEKLGLAPLAD